MRKVPGEKGMSTEQAGRCVKDRKRCMLNVPPSTLPSLCLYWSFEGVLLRGERLGELVNAMFKLKIDITLAL